MASKKPPMQPTPPVDLNAPEYYVNPYLGQLKFNLRVLEQALDESYPLLERLKFLLIFSSNMDEFFEVRLGNITSQIRSQQLRPAIDGMLPGELMEEIARITHDAVKRQYHIFNHILLPELARENIHFRSRESWTAKQRDWVRRFFKDQVQPVLTPIALDQAHPFPLLINKSLNFICSLEGKDAFGRQLNLAIVPAPRSLPRIIRLPDDICDGGENYIFISSVIHENASDLFPGMNATGIYQFRLTRNAELQFDESKVEDLQSALKVELFSRRYGAAVRLEVADNTPDELVEFLLKKTGLTEQSLYRVNGPVNLVRLFEVTDLDKSRLRFKPFLPKQPPQLKTGDSMFDIIRKGDLLLHHPYESFNPVVQFIAQAARDPNVLAIKQTLYRTEDDSKLVEHLLEACRNGKEVTTVVELRARFDEENNIEDSQLLQTAGAIVVYGIVGFKTHAKMVMVVRKEGKKLRRYVHLGTGNYHANNARLYTDFSLFTADEAVCGDVHKIFQELTGLGKAAKLKKLYHSPFTLHERILECIQQETHNARAGKPACIQIKANAITDKSIIQALYVASQAGVKIDMVIRGMCCLLPGIASVSENIQVRSVIGRFLEHARVYAFHNLGDTQVYCSSADLMPRNLYSRIETLFPIEDAALKARVIRECFEYAFADNRYAWQLGTSGNYTRVPRDDANPQSLQLNLLQALASE